MPLATVGDVLTHQRRIMDPHVDADHPGLGQQRDDAAGHRNHVALRQHQLQHQRAAQPCAAARTGPTAGFTVICDTVAEELVVEKLGLGVEREGVERHHDRSFRCGDGRALALGSRGPGVDFVRARVLGSDRGSAQQHRAKR